MCAVVVGFVGREWRATASGGLPDRNRLFGVHREEEAVTRATIAGLGVIFVAAGSTAPV